MNFQSTKKRKNDEEVGISENLKDAGNQSSINYIQITDTLLKIKQKTKIANGETKGEANKNNI